MIPANLDITIYRGDDFSLIFRMRDSVTNSYVDLTGRTARGQIRATPTSETIIASFTCTVLNQTTTPGGVLVTLSPALSAALPLDGGVWDVEVANADRSWVRTPLAGAVTVLAEVTR